MLQNERPSPERLHAIKGVKAMTRERFSLRDDIVVSVAQIACGQPGCPPLETSVTFWTTPQTRHQFKIFKPVAEVTDDDLPPYWMRDALICTADEGCC